jgi:hypothetical protein
MGDYRAPSLDVLRRPFEAMAIAKKGHRYAAAVLSASWSLYEATESRLRMAELDDAAMLLQAAIDALCEPESPTTDDERWKRWEGLATACACGLRSVAVGNTRRTNSTPSRSNSARCATLRCTAATASS